MDVLRNYFYILYSFMSTTQETIRWYNDNAHSYAMHVRNDGDAIFHSLYEKPAMYSLLPPLNDKKVLSLGCGSGEDSMYLKRKGAAQSVGIDISIELLKIAEHSYPACEFRHMDIENLIFRDESFDFAFSSLVMHYIEDWTRAMREIYRVLKPGSHFLFSCYHPLILTLEATLDTKDRYVKQLSIIKDKKNGSSIIVGDYLNRRKTQHSEHFAVTVWKKPFGEIINEILSAGFLVNDIIEPRPKEKMKQLSPATYQMLQRVPYFVIFKLYKP